MASACVLEGMTCNGKGTGPGCLLNTEAAEKHYDYSKESARGFYPHRTDDRDRDCWYSGGDCIACLSRLHNTRENV